MSNAIPPADAGLRLTLLTAMQARLLRASELDQVLGHLALDMPRIVPCAAMSFSQAERDELVTVSLSADGSVGPPVREPAHDSLAGQSISEGAIVHVAGIDGGHSPWQDARLSATVAVPVLERERVVGALTFVAPAGVDFDSFDVALINQCAGSISARLEHVSLLDNLRSSLNDAHRITNKLARLYRMSKYFDLANSEHAILRIVARFTFDVIASDRIFVIERVAHDTGDESEDGAEGTVQQLAPRIAPTNDQAQRDTTSVGWTNSAADLAISQRACTTIDDLRTSSHADARALADAGMRSALFAPLGTGREATSVLVVASAEADAFRAEDQAVMSQVGALVGTCLRAVRLHSETTTAKEEAERAQQAAISASEAKSSFLANMSHEIRTPLNAIIGMTNLLLESNLDGEQHEFVDTVRTSGNALLTLINEILDYSKVEANQMELEEQIFNLRDCVEESIDLVTPQAATKGLDVGYSIHAELPETMVGDVSRVRQVLVNLLGNAVKFTAAGEIAVRVLPGDDRDEVDGLIDVRIEVEDTGIGVPLERQSQVFEPFRQADASMSRRYGGTGLGLVISRQLARLMGGDLTLSSTEGEGSRFTFSLSLSACPHERPSHDFKAHVLKNRSVFAVIGSQRQRAMLTNVLETWGMSVTNGHLDEAAEHLATNHYDFVLVDHRVDRSTGASLVVPARRRSPKIRFVGLVPLGVDVIELPNTTIYSVTKPVKHHQLATALIRALSGATTTSEPEVKSAFDAELGDRHPLRILIAEDNVVNQRVAMHTLKRLGYRAEIASNGREAVEALDRQPYDLVLMDVQMPEMDGVEATRTIRKTFPSARQPRIVALTANVLEGERERLLAEGMNDYVSKPININSLVLALRRTKPLAGDWAATPPTQTNRDAA